MRGGGGVLIKCFLGASALEILVRASCGTDRHFYGWMCVYLTIDIFITELVFLVRYPAAIRRRFLTHGIWGNEMYIGDVEKAGIVRYIHLKISDLAVPLTTDGAI